jgi:tRNA dimethylallyltransferase
VDSHHLNDAVSASKFEEEGLKILEKEFKTNDIVMLAGGSGMFVDALCVGLDPIPTDPIVKESVNKDYKENGLAYLLEELKQSDPDYYRQVDQQNAIRVQRALEVIRITGKPYSTLRTGSQKVRPFKVHRFVLDHPREQLYERINKRVDLMIAAGLEDEAKAVIKWRHLTTMNTVGYKELFEFFDGKTNRTDAIAAIKQNTRRYAKRQLTWLRRHPESHWIKYTDKDAVVREILAIFEGIRSTK